MFKITLEGVTVTAYTNVFKQTIVRNKQKTIKSNLPLSWIARTVDPALL